MIESLTKEQEAKLSVYRDLWIKKGLTVEQSSLEDAKIDFSEFQTVILKMSKPAPVVLLNSPQECWDAIIEHYATDGGKEKATKKKLAEVRKEVGEFIWPYFDCQFWAGWFSYYEYMKNELGVTFSNEKEYNVFKACQKYGMVFPLEDICIVCQPPTVLKKNASGLHCENGAAVSYSGENEIYALNGVVMPKELVMTSASKLSAKKIMGETNAEIRRELIRKVGIERVMDLMPHKLLDKRDNYELYSLELSEEVKDARYLKMTNPSIGVFHLEGVAPEIKNITEALEWRNQKMFVDAQILT